MMKSSFKGILHLWAGCTPAVYRHIGIRTHSYIDLTETENWESNCQFLFILLVYTGSRLVFYEQFRDYFKKDKDFPLW